MSSRSHGSRKTVRRPTHNVTNPTVILRRKQKARVADLLARIAAVDQKKEALRLEREYLERQLAEFVTADDAHLFDREWNVEGIDAYMDTLGPTYNATDDGLPW